MRCVGRKGIGESKQMRVGGMKARRRQYEGRNLHIS